jgi:hypothetical protein
MNNDVNQEVLSKSELRRKQKEERKAQHEAIISSMSEADYANMQLEKMRYFDNKTSHTLGYIGIVASLLAMFFALNTISPAYFLGGVGTVLAILMNIFILLTGFLTVEKVKTYSIGYSKYMIGLGVVSVLRIFWYPLSTMILYNNLISDIKSGNYSKFSEATYKFNNKLGASILEGTPVDKNGVNCSTNLQDFDHIATAGFFSANGNIRGIVMIVLLVISAACFIAGGIIGYIKATKLKKYLASLEN